MMPPSRASRFSLPMLRTTLWALRARHHARKAVWGVGIGRPVALPPAPPSPREARRAVDAVLIRTRATCLVQSLVLQRWFADLGEPVDVVIGVTAPSTGFRAHAWLDLPGENGNGDFTELHRLPPPAGRASRTAGRGDPVPA
jgi:hypothetical protein